MHSAPPVPAGRGLVTGAVLLLTIGGAAAVAATLPIEPGLGGDWRTGLGLWAARAVVALIPWPRWVFRWLPWFHRCWAAFAVPRSW